MGEAVWGYRTRSVWIRRPEPSCSHRCHLALGLEANHLPSRIRFLRCKMRMMSNLGSQVYEVQIG